MRLITIAEAAERINAKPWDVVRLIESGEIASVEYVDADSLDRYSRQEAGQ